MIRFEMDVSAADLERRTIEGMIVPYGEVGRIDGTNYRFAPGSVRLGRARTPLLVDHNRAEPVGVLSTVEQRDNGVLGRFTVDATPDGDKALIQAASGSRGSLSIGAEIDELEPAAGGVSEVTSARVLEVSLLALGAFEGAAVHRVAAEAEEPAPVPDPGTEEDQEPAPPEPEPEPEPAEPNPDQTELDTEPEPEPAPPAAKSPEGGKPMTVEAPAAPPVIMAAGHPSSPPELGAGELVTLFVRAQHGEKEAVKYLEAALLESISTDVTGLLPPQYERTVIGGKEVSRPLYNAFRSRPLPGVGLLVSKPKWTTPPDGAWAATVDADATSTKVIVGSQTADVRRWDWAGAIPWVVVQRSDPSIVDEIYSEAIQDFYLDVEAMVYAELSAAAPGVATSLGGAIAEFYTATGDRTAPDVILMAPDVWGSFADAGALSQPVAGGTASAGGGDLTSSFAGIPAVVSGTLAAGETILATRRAVDARTTEPVRLTANAIGALNVELAVVGEGLFDTDYPSELLKFAAIVPTLAGTPAAASSSRRSSSN